MYDFNIQSFRIKLVSDCVIEITGSGGPGIIVSVNSNVLEKIGC